MKTRILIVSMATLICFAAVSTALIIEAAQPIGSVPEMTEGVVRKIVKDTGKITIKHGEIKNLNMPPMTMVYTVHDKSLLDSVQNGDKVVFKVIQENGKFVITEIHPAAASPN